MQPWEVGILTQLEIHYNNSDLPGAKKKGGGNDSKRKMSLEEKGFR